MHSVRIFLSQKLSPDIISALVILSVLLALWIPHGFVPMQTADEWARRNILDGFETAPLMQAQIDSRPLLLISTAMGYMLTPNSYAGDTVVLILTLWVKGMMFYVLMRQVFRKNRLLCFLVSVLFILYPSDTSIVSTRVTYHHLSVAAYLFAVYCFLLVLRYPRLAILGIAVGLSVTLLLYESYYPLVFITPILIIPFHRKDWKRFVPATACWYLLAILMLARFLAILLRPEGSMQSGIYVPRAPIGHLIHLLLAYYYNLIYPYARSLLQFVRDATWQMRLLTLLASLATGAVCVYLVRHQNGSTDSSGWSRRNYLYAALAGLLCIGIGYIAYLPSARAGGTTYRVYLISSIGASVFVGLVAYLLSDLFARRHTQRVFAAIMIGLIALAFNRASIVLQEYVTAAATQQSLLRSIVEQAPDFTRSPAILVIGDGYGNPLSGDFIGSPEVFTAALNDIYHRDHAVQIGVLCFSPRGLQVPSRCQFSPTGIEVLLSDDTSVEFGYDEVIVFVSDVQGPRLLETLPGTVIPTNPENYQPGKLINKNAALPTRWYSLATGDN